MPWVQNVLIMVLHSPMVSMCRNTCGKINILFFFYVSRKFLISCLNATIGGKNMSCCGQFAGCPCLCNGTDPEAKASKKQ